MYFLNRSILNSEQHFNMNFIYDYERLNKDLFVKAVNQYWNYLVQFYSLIIRKPVILYHLFYLVGIFNL